MRVRGTVLIRRIGERSSFHGKTALVNEKRSRCFG